MAFIKMVLGMVCGMGIVDSMVISSATCADKVACHLYPPTICDDPQYISWRMTNCPQYCGLCKLTTASHIGVGRFMDSDNGVPTCKDQYPNCAEYGSKICDDVKFYNWVNEHCKAHCNRCSDECKDTIPNCSEYGGTVCTELSYFNWVEMHCRKFCGRCQS